MFSANDGTQTSNDDPAMLDNVKQLASQPANQVVPPAPGAPQDPTQAMGHPAPAAPAPVEHQATPAAGFSSQPVSDPAQAMPAPGQPPASSIPAPTPPTPNVPAGPPPQIQGHNTPPTTAPPTHSADPSPFAATPTPAAPGASAPAHDDPGDDSTMPADPDHLAGLKKDALDHLEPLSDHIDGDTPEETFKRTMMMIQANDNHSLIEKALASAKQITDDKERAQALLDIINEINYFSQNNSAD